MHPPYRLNQVEESQSTPQKPLRPQLKYHPTLWKSKVPYFSRRTRFWSQAWMRTAGKWSLLMEDWRKWGGHPIEPPHIRCSLGPEAGSQERYYPCASTSMITGLQRRGFGRYSAPGETLQRVPGSATKVCSIVLKLSNTAVRKSLSIW